MLSCLNPNQCCFFLPPLFFPFFLNKAMKKYFPHVSFNTVAENYLCVKGKLFMISMTSISSVHSETCFFSTSLTSSACVLAAKLDVNFSPESFMSIV